MLKPQCRYEHIRFRCNVIGACFGLGMLLVLALYLLIPILRLAVN